VIDNERYGETGMQTTHTASGVNLAAVAKACGFKTSRVVTKNIPLRDTIHRTAGPHFLQIKVIAEKIPLVLPPQDGVLLKDRFRRALLGKAEQLATSRPIAATTSLCIFIRSLRARLAISGVRDRLSHESARPDVTLPDEAPVRTHPRASLAVVPTIAFHDDSFPGWRLRPETRKPGVLRSGIGQAGDRAPKLAVSTSLFAHPESVHGARITAVTDVREGLA
jgi:hypothetical protein